jgi:hypothetical protein
MGPYGNVGPCYTFAQKEAMDRDRVTFWHEALQSLRVEKLRSMSEAKLQRVDSTLFDLAITKCASIVFELLIEICGRPHLLERTSDLNPLAKMVLG